MKLFLLTVCTALLTTAACAGGDDGRRIPAPGVIVYTEGVDLWIQDVQGSRLLIQAGQDQQLLQPAISPDGRRVAYVVFQLTQAEGTSIGTDLAVADLVDPRPEIVLQHTRQAEFLWTPRWTPDGRSLIFTHEFIEDADDAGLPAQRIRIAQLQLEESELSLLREDARDADISPDGRRIVFVDAPYSGDTRLIIRELESGIETVLDPEGAWEPRPFRIPRFRSDGEAVIFSAGQFRPMISANWLASGVLGRNGPEDIWSVDLETLELTQLAALGEDQPDFALSDDGGHVLIFGAFGVYLVAVPPSDPPFAIAPGEFHGFIDWRGSVSATEWAAIRAAIPELAPSSQ